MKRILNLKIIMYQTDSQFNFQVIVYEIDSYLLIFKELVHSESKQVGLLHNTDELLFRNLTVTIAIGLVDHLLQLVISHGLP
jgi:hypothetical protein